MQVGLSANSSAQNASRAVVERDDFTTLNIVRFASMTRNLTVFIACSFRSLLLFVVHRSQYGIVVLVGLVAICRRCRLRGLCRLRLS